MFGIIQSSMLADIVEQSEMRTGRREEGLFFAAHGPSLMILHLLALGSISFYQITRHGHEERFVELSTRPG